MVDQDPSEKIIPIVIQRDEIDKSRLLIKKFVTLGENVKNRSFIKFRGEMPKLDRPPNRILRI